MSDPAPAPKRRLWLRILIVIGVLVIVLPLGFGLMLWSWVDLDRTDSAGAAAAFADALREAGDRPPFLEMDDDGGLVVHHELAGAAPWRILGLHLVAWHPEHGRLVRADLPGWFVRSKMQATVSFDTFLGDFGVDWRESNELIVEDLVHFGHGLLLDHAFADGRRVLIWQAAEARP